MITCATVPNASHAKDSKISATFVKKDLRTHIIDLPDSYVGASQLTKETIFLLTDTGFICEQCVEFVPALYKIIDELFVNSWDQMIRLNSENLKISSKAKKHLPVKHIDISVSSNELMVRNDGDGIEIAMHPEHNVWTVELIFGHLLTSTNYHKGEKLTGGKNGYGAKLANIFSHRFEVITVDRRIKKRYTQVFENNMQVIHPPTIEDYTGEPYTQITVVPDLERFQITDGWTKPMQQLIQKRAYDLSACGGKDLIVTFNGDKVPVQNLTSYMSLFPTTQDGAFVQSFGPRWEVGVALSEDGFRQMSFVNGVWTIKGGKHVDYIANQIARKTCALIEKKEKVKVKPQYVKENLMLFVKSMISNPSFDGQTKETLTTPSAKFGSKCELTNEFMDKVYKLKLVDRVMELFRHKESVKTKREEGRKRGRLTGIPKLDDANKAGGKEGYKCTLILTEGDSAKAMAISGLSEIGRDYYGVFPLRGKLINARQKTEKGRLQMQNNEEMCNVKKIVGLEKGKEYNSEEDIKKNLRYGRIMIMTDQDVDGSHIKGLIMNWIDAEWPSLLSRDFISSMITPILKARKGKKEIPFYSEGDYLTWKETAEGKENGWTVKYYKGLGTSTTKEAKEYFRPANFRQVFYEPDVKMSEPLDMVFNKDRADDRKDWMKTYDAKCNLDANDKRVTLTNFVDKELKHFSISDTQRSIGSVVDGLKPSQRKTLFACFKRKLFKEIKVAQLAGYVSEHTGYHHGEASLNQTIIGMAQNFVGSNNINLLVPNGQFGSRLSGGKDHASPRYIYTLLHSLTSLLFHPDDQPLLDYLEDDGQLVEPRYYVPILPVGMVNGALGVGTGWSTSIPNFNPLEICDVLMNRLKAPQTTPTEFPNLHPYYNGFTGKVIQRNPTSYITVGDYKLVDYKTVEITELPIGTWTDDYKEFLETLLVDYSPPKKRQKTGGSFKNTSRTKTHEGVLKNYTNNSTESTVHFILEFVPGIVEKWAGTVPSSEMIDTFQKNLKLTSCISMKNMHFFDSNCQIKKYDSVSDIMQDFYSIRLDYYVKRRQHKLGVLKHELDILQFKVKFLEAVIADEIVVGKCSKAELESVLATKGYPQFCIGEAKSMSYQYLLSMPIYTLTTDTLEKLRQQREEKHASLVALEALTPENIWLNDLTAFREQYVALLPKKTKKTKTKSKDSKKTKTKSTKSTKKPAAKKQNLNA